MPPAERGQRGDHWDMLPGLDGAGARDLVREHLAVLDSQADTSGC